MLLSEREADRILAEMRCSGSTPSTSLLSLTYLAAALEDGQAAPLLSAGACSSAAAGAAASGLRFSFGGGSPQTAGGVGTKAVVSALLFAGWTQYGSREEVKQQLAGLVVGRRAEVEALVAVRGRSERFPRSQVEAACDGIGH